MSQHKRGRITIQHQPPKQTRIAQKLGLIPFLIVSGLFVIIGLTQLEWAGLFGVVWTLMAACFFISGLFQLFLKNDLPDRVGYDVETDVEEETIVGLFDDVDEVARSASLLPEAHDHIPSTALDAKRRLEQLESLRSAGLITEQEHRQKRQEILHDL